MRVYFASDTERSRRDYIELLAEQQLSRWLTYAIAGVGTWKVSPAICKLAKGSELIAQANV